MTKIEIISRVAEDTGLTKVKAEEAVETIIDVVKATLKNGEPVILRRFGSFRVRSKSDRIGRNPKTGETVAVPEKRMPFFKAGKEIKELLNSSE